MKMKRFLSLALVLVMMLGLLAACTGGNNDNTDPSSAPSSTAASPEDSKKPAEESGVITLGIWPEDTEAEAISAMEWVQKMVQDKCVTDDPTQENWGTGFDRIGTSTAAMYIAANDAVDQPSYRGMAAKDFFLAPMPAGPGGHYALMGGTPYFFSPDATDDEVRWALDYLEIMGKSPEVSDDARQGWIADAEYRVGADIPVIPTFPAWTGAVVTENQKIVEQYSNVDMDLWQPYFDFATEGVRNEEPGDTQAMYTILNGVLQAICADPAGVNIPALMEQANTDYQAILDAK